jgi:hypothetical protein
MDTGLFPAGKAADRHAEPSPAFSAEIKNEVYFSSRCMPPWRGQGHLYFYFSFKPSLVNVYTQTGCSEGYELRVYTLA